MKSPVGSIAVCYLARGAEPTARASFGRFLAAYAAHPAGVDHDLHVLYKGFAQDAALREARALFGAVAHTAFDLDDLHFDIGAYIDWANRIGHDTVCMLNTASEPCAHHWLRSLAVNLACPGVGLVGATGSFESLEDVHGDFPPFPNVHVRSNAFMIDRARFCRLTQGLVMDDKMKTFRFESGREGLTRRVQAEGLEVLVVGRDGRGFPPRAWPVSGTFRQGRQENLLVADNQTREHDQSVWLEKRAHAYRSWDR